jgi:hypothetical protein
VTITLISAIRSAHEAGVTYAVASLASYSGLIGGLSATIRTGAHHALEKGAIVQEVTALHVTIERYPSVLGPGYASISTQVHVLRNLLLGSHKGVASDSATAHWFRKVAHVSKFSSHSCRLYVTFDLPPYRASYPLL